MTLSRKAGRLLKHKTMIDYVKGKLDQCSPTCAIVDCGGVGYAVNISLSTYAQIKEQQEVKLLVHEAIREDAYNLYGFAVAGERELFRMLISVSGVGATTAILILSAYPANEILRAITHEDLNTLKGIKGIGLKTAQRIVVELKDKAMKAGGGDAGEIFPAANNMVRQEALSALEVLGFVKSASQKVVDKLLHDNPEMTVEGVVKQAIKLL